MRYLTISILLMFIFSSLVYSFEVYGLKSGMTMEEARTVLAEYSYDKTEIKENHIGAWDIPTKGTNRSIYLNFCKGKLVQVWKDLTPHFDYFVRLVDEKRRELGRPIDAWSEPTDIESTSESNSISFLWKDGTTYITVSYSQFPNNNQLYIIYEIKNDCWEIPY